MDYFIIFIFGFVTGWMLLRALVHHRVNTFKNNLLQAIEKKVPEEVGIKFTKHKGIVQVHNSETQEFLVQGTSKEEIVQLLENRYPNIIFKANSKNMSEVFDAAKD